MHIKGFTLIELLIVVAIIGILAAIAVPNFMNARVRAQISRVVSDERAVVEAYQLYNLDQGKWPPHIDTSRAQHHYVTTPIAYLSTSVIDIFAASALAKTDTTWVNSQGQYHCEPAAFWHTNSWAGAVNNNPQYFKTENRNAAYFVMSYGPDQKFDQYKPEAQLYNASNGTTSDGDILTPVPGQFQTGYPYTQNMY